MVTKSMKFTDAEWSVIEQELQKSGKSFSDFARERLTKQQKTENTKLKDFAELLKNNCKALDLQIAKYISVLLERIDKQQEKINKILENNVYADFTIIANYKDKEKITDINFYRVGDFLANKQGIINVILKINKEEQKILVSSYPFLIEKGETETKWVDLKDIVKKLYYVFRIIKD